MGAQPALGNRIQIILRRRDILDRCQALGHLKRVCIIVRLPPLVSYLSSLNPIIPVRARDGDSKLKRGLRGRGRDKDSQLGIRDP